MKGSFWKLPERETPPLCPTWSDNILKSKTTQRLIVLHYTLNLLHLVYVVFVLFIVFPQLNEKEAPDIHCRDSVGNTPLHCAAYRGHKQCIIKLLKSGANPCIKNHNGISPYSSINGIYIV